MLERMKRVDWTRTGLWLLCGALMSLLYLVKLGAIPSGRSPAEAAAAAASQSLSSIATNPLYAPHKLLQWASTSLFGPANFYLRLPSALFAMFFIFTFYKLAKMWFGKFISFLAALIFASLPLVLLTGRSALPYILFLAPSAILAIYYWFNKKPSALTWLALCLVVAIALYVPGMFWFVLVGVIYARNKLGELLPKVGMVWRLLGIALLAGLFAPMIYASIKHSYVAKELLLIPHGFAVLDFIKTLAWSLLSFVFRTPRHYDLQIGRLALLDWAVIALCAFGLIAIYKHAKDKLPVLIWPVALACLAASLSKNVYILLIAFPTLAMLVAGGIRFLYMEWRAVFPKNPLPKYLAFALLGALVAIHLYYGFHYTHAAWPNTQAVRTSYVIK